MQLGIYLSLSSKFKHMRLVVGRFSGNGSGFGLAYFLLHSPAPPSFQANSVNVR